MDGEQRFYFAEELPTSNGKQLTYLNKKLSLTNQAKAQSKIKRHMPWMAWVERPWMANSGFILLWAFA